MTPSADYPARVTFATHLPVTQPQQQNPMAKKPLKEAKS